MDESSNLTQSERDFETQRRIREQAYERWRSDHNNAYDMARSVGYSPEAAEEHAKTNSIAVYSKMSFDEESRKLQRLERIRNNDPEYQARIANEKRIADERMRKQQEMEQEAKYNGVLFRYNSIPNIDAATEYEEIYRYIEQLKGLFKEFNGLGNYKNAKALALHCGIEMIDSGTRILVMLTEKKNRAAANVQPNYNELEMLSRQFRLTGALFSDMKGAELILESLLESADVLEKEAIEGCERQRRAELYNSALSEMRTPTETTNYFQLANDFRELGHYLDSEKLAEECKRIGTEIERKETEKKYRKSKAEMNSLRNSQTRDPEALRELSEKWSGLSRRFKSIGAYEDSLNLSNECKKESEGVLVKANHIAKRRETFAFSGKKALFGVLSAAMVIAIFAFVLMSVDIFFDPFRIYPPDYYPSSVLEIINRSSLFPLFSRILVGGSFFFMLWNGFYCTRKKFSISFSILGTLVGASIFGLWVFSGDRNHLTGMQIFTPAFILMAVGCLVSGLVFALIRAAYY